MPGRNGGGGRPGRKKPRQMPGRNGGCRRPGKKRNGRKPKLMQEKNDVNGKNRHV